MRTLKFRYWNTITKEMVNNPKMPYKENWTIEQLFEDRGWVWMQFTGLTDRHGVEIYEGDILSVCTGDLSTGGIGRVVWFESGCNFAVTGFLTEDHHHAFPDMHQEGEMHHQLVKYLVTEVIGNIYENPELLENSNA